MDRQLLPILLAALLALNACRAPAPDPVYNACRCHTDSTGHGALRFRSEGPEERLRGFVRRLRESLGQPRVTFLNYTIEDYDEFFAPERRAINPEILASPFGIQKIMVWDSLRGGRRLSVQIEQQRDGPRPVDRKFCVIEFRLRDAGGNDLLAGCAGARRFREPLQHLVAATLGPPHAPSDDAAWKARAARYDAQHAAYARRVAPVLDGQCYPPITHRPGTQVMQLQLCEREGLRDTLRARVLVLDAAGGPVPFYLYDFVRDTFTREVTIFDGYLGYTLYSEAIGEIAEIWFRFRDGKEVLFYEKTDFFREPLPFRPRFDPDYFRRRRLRERARNGAAVSM